MEILTLGDIKVYMDRLWEVLTGDYPPLSPREIPLLVSLCFYASTIVFGRQTRRLVRRFAPASILPYAMDFVVTFQLMACSLENGQIRKHYGSVAYVGIMFTMGMWSYLTIAGEGKSNPCAHVIRYMKGTNKSLVCFLLHVCCQLAGGLLSFPYARLFWYLELTESHASRYWSLHCTTDLTVPTAIGFLIEFGATFIDVLLTLTTFTPFLFYEVATKSLISYIMVVLGIDLTGMYMNPINATNQKFGCRGINMLEHIIVYWLSVLLAGVLGVVIHTQLGQCWKTVVKTQANGGEDATVKILGGAATTTATTKTTQKMGDITDTDNNVLNSEDNNSNNSQQNHRILPATLSKPNTPTTTMNVEEKNIEGEIYTRLETEVIKDEATDVSEDVIFQTAEARVMNGDSFDFGSAIPTAAANLNQVTNVGQMVTGEQRKVTEQNKGMMIRRGISNSVQKGLQRQRQTEEKEKDVKNGNVTANSSISPGQRKPADVITDFDQEFDEMRRLEQLHNSPSGDVVASGAGRGGRYVNSEVAKGVNGRERKLSCNGEGDSGDSNSPESKLKKPGVITSSKSLEIRTSKIVSPTKQFLTTEHGRKCSSSSTKDTSTKDTSTKDSSSSSTRHRQRSMSGSRIPVRTERKRSTSRSRIPVMKEGPQRRSRLKSE